MRSVSIWVEFLMYISFILAAISITLYAASEHVEANKTKLIIEQIINTLLNLEYSIENVYSCYECIEKITIVLPKNSVIYFDNGMIYALFYSRYLYNKTTELVNISIEEKNNLYLYNISVQTKPFVGNFNGQGEICILMNKSINILNITRC